MPYADCHVVPVPKKSIEKYRELAKLSAKDVARTWRPGVPGVARR